MKKIVIANWKMNPPTFAKAHSLFKQVVLGIKNAREVNVVFCPPFVFLPQLEKKNSKLKFGAQNVFWEKEGAYTGEVSVPMLKSLGIKYVIVGHSERREHLGETNEIIKQKIKLTLKHGLKVVFCVGEKTRDGEDYYNFVKTQVVAGLHKVPKNLSKNIIIAYEPLWAIGTGKAVKPQDLYEMATYIRRVVFNIFGKKIAYNMPVLYGGSVNSKNALEFLEVEGVDGLLVGGASLNEKEFINIVKEASKA